MTKNLVVINSENRPVTTSLIVADRYEIRHKHIIAKIRNIQESQSEFFGGNFHLKARQVRKGRGKGYLTEAEYYEMTRQGWMFLTMKLSGPRVEAALLS